MRPIFRGNSPQAFDYADHRDAFGELASRLGMYCSYCERRIATLLAVEHIQPKGLPAYKHLYGRWDNYLLACVNCNSTKKEKEVILGEALLPDHDNTAAAYEYSMDGTITIPAQLTMAQQTLAKNTLKLVGLDKKVSSVADSNGQLVAIDRVTQRMEVWLIAQESRSDLRSSGRDAVRRQVAKTAVGHGFFSIWMTVFADDREVRKLLISAFMGTAKDCFDPITTDHVSPRPANGLADGSKI